MIAIHAAELAAAIRPCVQDLWIARRTEEIEQVYERKLGELAALDAKNEPIEVLLSKVEEIGAVDQSAKERDALIEQLEALMKRCMRALDEGSTHLAISKDLADVLAPYRESALRQMLGQPAATRAIPGFAPAGHRNEVMGMGKDSMAA